MGKQVWQGSPRHCGGMALTRGSAHLAYYWGSTSRGVLECLFRSIAHGVLGDSFRSTAREIRSRPTLSPSSSPSPSPSLSPSPSSMLGKRPRSTPWAVLPQYYASCAQRRVRAIPPQGLGETLAPAAVQPSAGAGAGSRTGTGAGVELGLGLALELGL